MKKHKQKKLITVDCPRRLQRYMLRNLHEESRNRVSPDRAARATVILEEIRCKAKEASARKKPQPQQSQPVQQPVPAQSPIRNGPLKRIVQTVKNKCHGFLQSFRKGNR